MIINFSIEKPAYMPFLKDRLLPIQKSGEWYGEIKLNEHRSFIIVDDRGDVSIRSYRDLSKPLFVNCAAIQDLKKMKLPKESVFDGGYVNRRSFGELRIWIFDVLMLRGKRLSAICLDRRNMRNDLIDPGPRIWLPASTDKWLDSFEKMLNGGSYLSNKNALQCGCNKDQFFQLVEGIVVKRKTSQLHYFPTVKNLPASYFKLLRIRSVSGIK